jgi:Kef-type K+ transport system membrane component KefB
MVSEQVILNGVLTVSLLVFFAKIFAGAFSKIGIPPVLGELASGVILGPYALGQFLVIFGTKLIDLNDIVLAFSEIGAILILFAAGLEMSFVEFRGVGVKSFIVGGFGVAVPFFSAMYAMLYLGFTLPTALIVGAALSATSIAITVSVLSSLNKNTSSEGKLMVNAAVVDDVLGLAVLAVVVSIIQGGVIPSVSDIMVKLASIIVLWLVMLVVVVAAVPRFLRVLPPWGVEGTEEAAATVVCFGSASLATILGLSPIVGAYAAGMGFAGTKSFTRVKSYIDKINLIFAPVFFAVVGASLNFYLLTPYSLLLMIVLFAIAVLSKIAGCGLPAGILFRNLRVGERVGVGMISRGEVGLVISGIGLTTGVIDQNVYAALVGVVFFTTFISPVLLKAAYKRESSKNSRVVEKLLPKAEIQPEIQICLDYAAYTTISTCGSCKVEFISII